MDTGLNDHAEHEPHEKHEASAGGGLKPAEVTNRSAQAPLGYIPQLDGVRALAILMVLFAHFRTHLIIHVSVHFGRLGVLLFFVLSGFLITGILLRCRDVCNDQGSSKWFSIRSFYVRRILRIFPIYYGTIFLLRYLQYPPVRDDFIWHLTYTSNISSAFFGRVYGHAGHLWSLCVEEQFYLMWPFVVIFCRPRLLHRIILFLMVGGVSYKVIGGLAGLGWKGLMHPLFGCLESLGVGALLAVYMNDPQQFQRHREMLIQAGVMFGLPLLICLQSVRAATILNHPDLRFSPPFFYAAAIDLAAALTFVVLVDRATRDEKGMLDAVLSWGPIRYIGRISYGMYLYHFPLVLFLPKLLGTSYNFSSKYGM